MGQVGKIYYAIVKVSRSQSNDVSQGSTESLKGGRGQAHSSLGLSTVPPSKKIWVLKIQSCRFLGSWPKAITVFAKQVFDFRKGVEFFLHSSGSQGKFWIYIYNFVISNNS